MDDLPDAVRRGAPPEGGISKAGSCNPWERRIIRRSAFNDGIRALAVLRPGTAVHRRCRAATVRSPLNLGRHRWKRDGPPA